MTQLLPTRLCTSASICAWFVSVELAQHVATNVMRQSAVQAHAQHGDGEVFRRELMVDSVSFLPKFRSVL